MPMPVKKPKARRHNRGWSRHDLHHMRRLAMGGLPARLAAPRLGRTVGSVKFKAMTEGIRFRNIAQKPGTQSTRAQRRRLSQIATRRWRAARAA